MFMYVLLSIVATVVGFVYIAGLPYQTPMSTTISVILTLLTIGHLMLLVELYRTAEELG